MEYQAKQGFAGVVGGVETSFKAGDTIDEATAKELGLADKPDLATPKGKK